MPNEYAMSRYTTANSGVPRRRAGLSGMVLAELRELAGELGMTGTAGMRKGDLIAAIKERQSNLELQSRGSDQPVTPFKEASTETTEPKAEPVAQEVKVAAGAARLMLRAVERRLPEECQAWLCDLRDDPSVTRASCWCELVSLLLVTLPAHAAQRWLRDRAWFRVGD